MKAAARFVGWFFAGVVFAYIVSGCTSTQATLAERNCPVIVVQNDNYHDVIVREEGGARLHRALGLSRTRFETCRLVNRAPRFTFRFFAHRTDVLAHGLAPYLRHGDRVRILVTAGGQIHIEG